MTRHLIAFFLFMFMFKFVEGQPSIINSIFISDNNDYVKIISDSTLLFEIEMATGFSVHLIGFGNYFISKDRIIVETISSEEIKHPYYLITDESKSLQEIEISITSNSKPVSFCNIELIKQKSGEVIFGTIADKNGYTFLDNLPTTGIDDLLLRFSLIGYGSYKIPLKCVVGSRLEVNLTPYKIIEDEKVIFLIQDPKTHTILEGPIFIDKSRLCLNYYLKMMMTNWPWNWYFRCENNLRIHFSKEDI